MFQAAKRMQKQRNDGTQIRNTNPFKKPWGVQTDGDVSEQVWEAIQTRGCDNETVWKVKGHGTQEDLDKSVSKPTDTNGNDKSDALAYHGANEK